MSSLPCYVNCMACLKTVWSGGRIADSRIVDLPVDDGQELLTAYAETCCSRPDCPHTAEALAAVKALDPAFLAAELAELKSLVTKLTGAPVG